MDSLTQWTNLLTSCFEDESLAQRLAADVDEAGDVSLSIQMFCSQQELPENIIRQATFLLDIFEVVGKSLPLFFFVLSDPQVRSLAEIAKRFYAIESIVECPAIDPTDSTNFKSELFRREPTAVICGLLDRNLIEHDNEKTQQQAIAFLQRAINKNFNISRTSVPLFAADDATIKQLPDDERNPLLRYLETLQRLHVVVTDAVEVNYLMRAGFTSAHDIASTNDYFDAVECEEFSRNAALAVWRRATAIDQRNEHRWADYIRSRTDIPVLALGTGQVSTETADDRVNIASLFGEMNQAQVDEYTSVISPAAYLVDLLEFLRYSLIDPPKDPSGNGKAPTQKNLQDELFERRPDIMNLELSKPNTLNPLRYADLANEVMESYIHSSLNLDGKIKVPNAFNESNLNTDDASTKSPFANTIWSVYEEKEAILNKVAPMKDFPFNLAVHTTKDILEAVGISRAIAIELFHNREEMRKIILTSKDSIAYSLVDEAFSRRLAAEHLGLDQDDFVAITREAYMSQEFVASTNFLQGVVSREAYGALIGLKSPGEYWGYSNDTTEDDANKMMIGQVSSIRGIDHIMLGLLPRGGISFQELLLILDTEFIGKTLVISVHDDNGYYTEDYNEMRLKSSPQAEEDGVTFAESCSRLHTFLRLWHRLGWSIADTDAAIMTVEAARLSGSPASALPIISSEITEDSGDPVAVEQSSNDVDNSANKLIPPWGDKRYLPSITPETIEDLAAVKQLSESTHTPISKLLPLWGDMRYEGQQSFYHKTFMLPGLLAQYPGLDKKNFESKELDDEDEDTPSDSDAEDEPNGLNAQYTVSTHLIPLQSLLGISHSDTQLLCEMSGVKMSDLWTIASVSTIYRYNLLCKLLGIPLAKLSPWFESDSAARLVFSCPRVTIKVLQRWADMRQNDCTPEWLLSCLQRSASQPQASTMKKEALTAAKLLDAYTEIERKYGLCYASQTPSEEIGVFTNEILLGICTDLFGPELASKILNLVEGSATLRTPCCCASTSTVPDKFSAKIIKRTNELICKALISQKEHQELKTLYPNDSAWIKAVNNLFSQSQAIQAHLTGLYQENTAALDFMYQAFLKKDLTSADLEKAICQRRKTFALLVVPQLKKKQQQLATRTLFREEFPLLEPTLTSKLMSSLNFSQSSRLLQDENLCEVLYAANDAANKPTESSADKNFTGFYVPKSTSDVIFTAPESSKVVFDGAELSCGKPTTFPLIQGKCYELTYAGSLGVFSVRASSSAGDSESISSNCLISSTTIASFMEVLGTLRRASSVLEKFKLSTNEADTLISTGVNMAQPGWKDLDCIQVFCELRDSTYGDKTTESFYHLLQKLSEGNISDPTLAADTMFHHISTYTSWSIQLMKDCVISKLHEQVSSSQSDFTWTYRCLLSIKQMTAAFDKIGLSTESMTDWIRLQLPKETKAEFIAAQTMVALMLKRNDGRVMAACEGLAAKKKAALITFLLSEDKIKAKKIYDANGLFEYFLIDVQMGTEQQTSRVQQAIATIQLYMQRCLLGLEVRDRLRPNSIDLKKWQWMQKFTLWHANRRVFLFPENWAEPSLRDDKSEAFKAIEAAVLQANLSKEKIADIIRQYIYGAHQVADLEVQSYFWERSDQFRGTYHLFARTRTAPYGYYYRALQVTGVRVSDPIYSWHPWSKLEVEIPTYEAEWDGNSLPSAGSYLVPTTYKGRLFLFMPQIMLKTLPKRPSEGSKTCEAYAKDIKVNDLGTQSYWEIKMGWSESLNGVWSTKRVSSASLDISGANKPTTKTPGTDETETDAILKGIKSASQDVNDLPGISSFRFWVRARQPKDYNKEGQMVVDSETDILVIDVFRWVKGSKESEYTLQTLGHFEMRGTHMVAIRETAPAISSTTRLTSPTYFNKLHLSTKDSNWEKLQSNLSNFKEVDSVGETLKSDACQPLLALAPPIKDDRQKLVWTMSYNEYQCSGASGLVVERMTGSRVESYFGAPDRVTDGSFNPAIKLAKDSRRMAYDTSQALMEKCSTSGSIDEIFSVLTNVSEGNRSSAFGGRGASKYSELASPYSLYNWELGFHIVMLLVERLLSTQQFELGLQVANMVFDPWLQASQQQEGTKAPSTTGASGNSSTTTKGVVTAKQPLKPAQETCWRFAPFKSSKMRTAGSMGKVIKELKAGKGTSNEVAEWLSNPFNAHSLARGRPVIYMRRLVRKYIELLIESGDELFRQSSLESIPLALQRYVQASHLFGSAPQSLPSPTKSTVKTYSQLFKHVNDFSSAAVDLELTFPFFANISGSSAMGIVDQSPKYKGVLGMVRSGYFSVPANPELAALRERIDLRLYQIRNSLDINGNKRRTPLFDPPIDPGQLVRSVAQGGMSSSFAGSVDGPMPNYRFLFLLQKAFEMCNELKSLSDAYLTIKEKKDAENLSSLRSSQDASTQLLALEIKKMQKEEAEKAIEILQETRESHVMRLKYYLALIGQPESKVPDSKAKWQDFQQAIGTPTKDEFVMSPEEYLEMNKTEEATFLRNIASGIERGCAILMALPNLSTNIQPMGMGASMKFDASNIAQSMQCIASAIQSESTQRSDEASRASRKGQLIRQLQERRLSANMAGRDIKNTDKQIESQRIKSKICDREIEMQNKQIADTSDVIAFLKSKYTNESLYAWMDASMRSLLYQTYVLTMDVAKSAEKAFLFERGPTSARDNLLASSYWDSGRNGAYAAQNLYLGLKRIETAYHKSKSHDYEISKDISLRQLDPWALLQLQETGHVNFSLPELLFDMDFPGHYCRRIKSVSVTIPCVHGPYTSVACMLRLLSHCYRLRQSSGSESAYYPPAQELDADTRYCTDRVPISSVAISTANQDNGNFEAAFSGERYGPFEGAGAISSWSLDLPKLRQFDYRSISDIILHVKYTSLDGGAGWTEAASTAVTTFQQTFGQQTFVSPFELSPGMIRNFASGAKQATIEIRNVLSQLPFWTRSHTVSIKQSWIIGGKSSKLDATTKINDMPVTPSSKTVGNMKVFETPLGNYGWEDLTITLPVAAVEDLRHDSLWALVGYTMS